MCKIKNIIADKFEIDSSTVKVTDEFVNDYGADSIDRVELIMDIEENYDIMIPDEDIEKFNTVQDCFDYVNSRVKQ